VTNNHSNQLYDQAVQSLKTLNNDLFYDELKTNLEKHENKMEKEYQKVQKLLEDWNTTLESVPSNLSHQLEEVNQHLLDLQDANHDKLNKEVIELFNEKQQAFTQILTSMQTFQKHLQEIYTIYKDLFDKQNDAYEAQLHSQQTQFQEFQQEMTKQLSLEVHNQTVIVAGKVDSQITELKSLMEKNLQSFTINLQTYHQKIILDIEQVTNMLEIEKTENEARLQEQFHVFNEIAATQVQKQDTATQQLIQQMQTQAEEAEHKYSTLKKIVIALTVGQALVLGSIWYFGL